MRVYLGLESRDWCATEYQYAEMPPIPQYNENTEIRGEKGKLYIKSRVFLWLVLHFMRHVLYNY